MAKVTIWTHMTAYPAGDDVPYPYVWGYDAVPHRYLPTTPDEETGKPHPDAPKQVLHDHEVRCDRGLFRDLVPGATRGAMVGPYALIEVDQKLVDNGTIHPLAPLDVPLEFRLGVEMCRARKTGDAAVETVFAREKTAGNVTGATGKDMAGRLLVQMVARGLSKAAEDRIVDSLDLHAVEIPDALGR